MAAEGNGRTDETAEGAGAGDSLEGGDQGLQGDRRTPPVRVPKPRGGRGGDAKVHPPQAGKTGKGRTGKDSQPGVTKGNTPAANYVITDKVSMYQAAETVKHNHNIAAVKTLKALQGEQPRHIRRSRRTLPSKPRDFPGNHRYQHSRDWLLPAIIDHVLITLKNTKAGQGRDK